MTEPSEATLEAVATDRLVRFIAAVLGKLPREAVEACRDEAINAYRYGSSMVEPLNDSYCSEMANLLLRGWAIRDLIRRLLNDNHAELLGQLSAAEKSIERYKSRDWEMSSLADQLRRTADRISPPEKT